jgi:hypothetical protein
LACAAVEESVKAIAVVKQSSCLDLFIFSFVRFPSYCPILSAFG